MIGTSLGPYEIIGRLGAGGMGEVYRARDTKLNRDVAIKVLPDMVADDPERLGRFEREAQLLASLNHANVAAIYGMEARAIVMELVDGETLEERMARPGGISLDEALEVAGQIADALEAAHEQGIVHRDLKPANVKVAGDGTVKVLDFGLAKALSPDVPGVDAHNSPTMTSPAMTAMGMILGTAAYMSPEQARGKLVDKRADIWAYGVVLFEMLTGQRLFPGETVSDVIAAVLTREVDWNTLPGDTPPSVRRLLTRCLQRDPRQRLRDIGDARFELQSDLSFEPQTAGWAAGSGSRSARRAAALIAGSGLAAAVLMFAFMSWRSPAAPVESTVVFPIPAPPGTRLEQVGISPDGGSLALVAESPTGVTQLWIRDLESRELRQLAGTEGARDLFWSPDSRFVGFFDEERLSKIEVESGAIESLAATSQPRGGAWNGEDAIVTGGGSGLQVVSAVGGSVSPVLSLDAPPGENATRYPSFLPDGNHVLFYSRNAQNPDLAGLWVVALETGVRKHLVPAASSSAVYLESGYLLYRRDRYLVAHPFDVDTLEFTGASRTVAEDIWYEPGVTALTSVSVSSTGTVSFRTGGPEISDLAWFDRRGQPQGSVWEPKSFATVGLSPDGTKLLTSFPGRGVEREVWLYDLPTETPTPIDSPGDFAGNAVFSGDGSRALLGLYADASMGTWMKRLASGAAPEPVLVAATTSLPTDWRGDLVVYEGSFAAGGWSLNLLDLSTGEDRPLVDGPGDRIFGSVSPDGRWLAYASDESGQWEVYVATFPSAEGIWRISTEGGHQPRWNPRGSELFYVSPDRRMMSVRVRDAVTSFEWDAPQPLFQTDIVDLGPYRGSWGYAVAPDGERFLILTRQPQGSSPAVAILNWR